MEAKKETTILIFIIFILMIIIITIMPNNNLFQFNFSYLCPPALIYVCFSLVQIIIDTFQKTYNIALIKFFIMIIFTFMLNILCKLNLGIISWLIVFIPFIFMTLTSASLVLFLTSKSDNIKTEDNSVNNDIIYL